jgi:MFS family permease
VQASASIRRNLFLLAAGMAALYGMVELAFGAATLTFEEVGGASSLAGLAPALLLGCAALAALPAGRAMDRVGARPTLLAGFTVGVAGSLLAAAGVAAGSLPLVLTGFALTGAATGVVLLSRAAAAAMVPPAGRPRAIALVLFGAVFGALLGPLVFSPLLGSGDGGSGLDLAWLGAGGFMLVGIAIASRLRPDSTPIAADRAPAAGAAVPGLAAGLRAAVSNREILPALLAVLASWSGMVTVMALVGKALVDHGHAHGAVFPVLSAHFIGMFAFFAIVGRVIEAIGRPRAIASGLFLLAISATALIGAVQSVHLAALVLLGVGLGWSLSFVAATAELAERAPAGGRATLIGFADLLGGLTGAAFVVAAGFALEGIGLAVVCVGASALPVAAGAWMLVAERGSGRQPPAVAAESA